MRGNTLGVLRVGADDGAEVVESARLVKVLDLLDPLSRQDRFCEALSDDLLVEVVQVALVPDGGDEGGGDALLEELLHVKVGEEGVHEDLVHILVLPQPTSAVFHQHLNPTTKNGRHFCYSTQ